MNELTHVTGYVMLVMSWLYGQISEAAEGVISKGFDAGLSVGLLIIGLIVLGWYHYKYQQHNRKVIAKMAEEKDEKTAAFHDLALQQIELSKDQIQTNKDIRRAINNLSNKIERL